MPCTARRWSAINLGTEITPNHAANKLSQLQADPGSQMCFKQCLRVICRAFLAADRRSTRTLRVLEVARFGGLAFGFALPNYMRSSHMVFLTRCKRQDLFWIDLRCSKAGA